MIIILLIIIIAFYVTFFTGLVDVEMVFFFIMGAIVGWIALILFAIVGAIFFGMFLSHRILSIRSFTPFEEEMLKMREEIKKIDQKLDKLMKSQKEEEGEKVKKEE